MIFTLKDRIVFAGDSITDAGSTKPVAVTHGTIGQGYVCMLDNMLTAVYPELFLSVVNAGINGNSSRDLLSRFQTDVVEMQPDWVSICIGVNDVWRQYDTPCVPEWSVQPQEYRSNLEAMITMVPDKVKGIFLLHLFYGAKP